MGDSENTIKKRRGLYFIQIGILGVVVIILVFVYQFWPWREYQFLDGIWQWFSWLSVLYPLARFEIQYRIIGSLFLVPLIFSVIYFRWYGTVIIYIISFASIYQLLIWGNIQYLLTNILFLIFPGVIALIVYFEFKLRQNTRQHYLELERERAIYLTKATEENENARQRIAQELHDDTIQTLLAIASHVEALEKPSGFDTINTKNEIIWIKETIRNTAEDLRRLSLDLRPSILDDMGLLPALTWVTGQSNYESKP
jgi:signal transduction histidine kinase